MLQSQNSADTRPHRPAGPPKHLTMPAPSCSLLASNACHLTCPALLLLTVQEVNVALVESPRYIAPPSCRTPEAPHHANPFLLTVSI